MQIKLSSSEAKVLKVLVEGFRKTGATPPLSYVEEETGQGSYVRQVVRTLVDKGFLSQPYRGRYVPLKDSEGKSVRFRAGKEEADEEIRVKLDRIHEILGN